MDVYLHAETWPSRHCTQTRRDTFDTSRATGHTQAVVTASVAAVELPRRGGERLKLPSGQVRAS